MKKILVLAGPTAAGKTAASISLAQHCDAEIVSCDSMQLYKYMDIGSAKPTAKQRADVPHHLIDCIDPREPFSVARYQELARKAIAEIHTRGKLPLVTGGTGLYLNSLLYDMDFGPTPRKDAYRAELEAYAQEHGADALHERLAKADPRSAERIHPHNVKRVIRALEAAEKEARPLADFASVEKRTADYEALLLGLTWDREELYRRIDDRVDQLFAAGLEKEVRGLMERGFSSDDIAMKGIGYKELLDHFAGEYDRAEAVRLIKRNTRHYAKRQFTWFRRYEDMTWYNGSEYESFDALLEDMKTWVSKRL